MRRVRWLVEDGRKVAPDRFSRLVHTHWSPTVTTLCMFHVKHSGRQLAERLRERIAADGPIPFSAFMEAALYDPEYGFYARGARIGEGGAFTTAAVALPL